MLLLVVQATWALWNEIFPFVHVGMKRETRNGIDMTSEAEGETVMLSASVVDSENMDDTTSLCLN